MKHMRPALLIAFFALAAIIILGGCAGKLEGTLKVTVLDEKNNPVQGVKVLVQSETTPGQTAYGETSEKGTVEFQLVPGTYRATITKQEYVDNAIDKITILPNQTESKTVTLLEYIKYGPTPETPPTEIGTSPGQTEPQISPPEVPGSVDQY